MLYGKNTLHITRTSLFLGLPRLFILDCLAVITEVELVQDELLTSEWTTYREGSETSGLRIFHSALPTTMLASLRRLHLRLQDGLYHGGVDTVKA